MPLFNKVNYLETSPTDMAMPEDHAAGDAEQTIGRKVAVIL